MTALPCSGVSMRTALSALAFLFASSLPSELLSQATSSPMDAQALYDAAKQDLQADRAAHALEKLKRGLKAGIGDRELEWTYRLAVAVAYDQLGKPVAALEATRRFVLTLDVAEGALTETWRARREGMRERARALEGRILETFGALALESEPDGARIFIDDAPAGVDGDLTTPFVVYLTPGRHSLRLEAPGRLSPSLTVDIVAGRLLPKRLVLAEEPKQASLLVETGAEDARVFVDGDAVGAGEHVSATVEPGEREVRVERSGYQTFAHTVRLAADSAGAKVLKVKWPDDAAGIGAPVDNPGVAGAGPRRPLDPLWGWIAGGSGLAVALVGIPFTVMALGDQESLDGYQYKPDTDENTAAFADLKTSMQQKELVAGVLYGVGGAALVGGAVWLLLSYNQDVTAADERGSVGFGVTPLPGGAGLSFGGRW